jgi:MarR family transcriptional regulator, organic hydroperoxide resistance regulator
MTEPRSGNPPAGAPTTSRVVTVAKLLARNFGERFRRLPLHVGQDRLLLELFEHDGLSQSELIERLGVEPPTVTGTVQRLERDGLLRREPDPANRRVSRVYLTDAGRALEQPIKDAWLEIEGQLVAELSPEEREQLLELLNKLRPRG